ncbi:MAG TPA: hypothetical protein VK157_00980 [Phycisphaerales bacterium]|nr:hypothetical protein [Phycisphaerales bacterium]
MHRSKVDPSIRRIVLGSFQFPLGVYPVEEMTPKQGYVSNFEPSDGGGTDGEFEEWPDRYVFDVVVSAERLPALCRMLFSLFDGRAYPILDVLGQDGYREVDPYISYDLVGVDVFLDGLREYGEWLYEDGMVGFGLMSEEPFCYVFVDEHKIITLRVDPSLKERVEKILSAFDLEITEATAGADAAAHEHRNVLMAPEDRPDLLGPDEVLERLKTLWRVVLNVDPDTNVDDEGKELGVTHWRAVVRIDLPQEDENEPDPAKVRYAEVVFDAANLREAEDITFTEVENLAEAGDVQFEDGMIVLLDRLQEEQFAQVLARAGVKAKPKAKAKPKSKAKGDAATKGDGDEDHAAKVHVCRWLG